MTSIEMIIKQVNNSLIINYELFLPAVRLTSGQAGILNYIYL